MRPGLCCFPQAPRWAKVDADGYANAGIAILRQRGIHTDDWWRWLVRITRTHLLSYAQLTTCRMRSSPPVVCPAREVVYTELGLM